MSRSPVRHTLTRQSANTGSTHTGPKDKAIEARLRACGHGSARSLSDASRFLPDPARPAGWVSSLSRRLRPHGCPRRCSNARRRRSPALGRSDLAPGVTVKSSIPPDQSVLGHKQARRDIEWPLRNLAANIMRISRGAGAPYDIGRQCEDVVEAFLAYWNRCGVWPSSEEVSQILSFRESPPPCDPVFDLERAIDVVTKGALRFAAGRLVDRECRQTMARRNSWKGLIGSSAIARKCARIGLGRRPKARCRRRNPQRSGRPRRRRPRGGQPRPRWISSSKLYATRGWQCLASKQQ